MDPHDDAVYAILQNRWFLYSFLGRLFAAEPDEDFAELIAGEHVVEEFSMLGIDDLSEELLRSCVRGLESNASMSLDSGADVEIPLETLTGDYTKLLIGPAKLPAPPWESVYVSREPLLFQESTLAVREAYARAGFEAAGYPREADDHVATELNFMAALSEQTVQALDEDKAGEYREALLAQQSFLNDHLLVWIREFSDRMSEVDGVSSFYPSFAALAALVCERDAEVIEELLASA